MSGAMRLAAGAVVFLASAGAARAYDVLHFRDRRDPVRGAILSETEDTLEFRIIKEGDKGEIAGSLDATFALADIKRIDRMPPAERGRVIARSEALGDRAMRLATALQKIEVSKAQLQGLPALQTTTKHFKIYTTCDERFLREVTHYVEEMFRAYRMNFRARPDAPTRIRIYLFATRDEYNRFQRTRIGGVLQNPAFYNSRENYIAVCNLVQKELADKIRARIKDAERQVVEYLDKIKDASGHVDREVHKAYRKVALEYSRVARTIPKNDKAARQRLDNWRREALRGVTHLKKKLRKALKEEKKRAHEYISKNRRVILHNNRVLLRENKQMFETLFHEGFHAFAYNYLWLDGRRCVVPRWLDEGFACYYQESVVEAGYLIHGGIDGDSIARLRDASLGHKLVPLSKIVAGDARDFLVAASKSGEHSGIYYAQSWALVHYMLQHVTVDQIQEYLRRLNSGADRGKAFEKLMGKPMAQVDAAVMLHVGKLD